MKRAYVKVYVDTIATITFLTPKARKVLWGLTIYLDEDNAVDLSAHKRKTLMSTFRLSKQSFSNGLVELVDSGILTHLDSGYFHMDPLYIKKQA